MVIAVFAAAGAVIIVGMTIAPNQPTVRDFYVSSLCPSLDFISTDICGAVRRAAGDKPA